MMQKNPPKIEPGSRIGHLTVLSDTNQRKNRYVIWRCRCDCGGEILLDTRCLQRSTVTDCGCLTRVTPRQRDLTYQRFGRLVCIAPTEKRGSSGGTVWRCQCDCGNECLAVSTQLTNGYKKSCGCLSHPPVNDLVGQKFGLLQVVEYAGKHGGMHRWRCRCDCGKETVVGQTLLLSGKTKSCGCNGKPPAEDIAGQSFGLLTVLAPVNPENKAGFWHCQCNCGNESVVRYRDLVTGHTKSCGCLQKSAYMKNLGLVDGTSVAILEANRKHPIATNSSGHTGVYLNKKTGKWIAQLTFKRKTYYLGCYDSMEEAVVARQKGEEMHDHFLKWYYETYLTEKSGKR